MHIKIECKFTSNKMRGSRTDKKLNAFLMLCYCEEMTDLKEVFWNLSGYQKLSLKFLPD